MSHKRTNSFKLIALIISSFLLFSMVFLTLTNDYALAEEDSNKIMSNEAEKKKEVLLTDDEWYNASYNYAIETLDRSKVPVEVKGLYISGNTAGGQAYDRIIDLINQTNLNSLVIDVKEDEGYVTYKSNLNEVKEVDSDRRTYIRDIDAVIKKAKENNIYIIARIVTFKDPFYAGAKPENAMQKKSGGVWKDKNGVIWIDPYNQNVWDYNLKIAKEVADKGFDEIQFDYVRFPANGKLVDQQVAFNNPENKSKAENIATFLAYAKKSLEDYPVYISADVFGLTTSVSGDMGIGQQWDLLAPIIDYISPMMYPSHYANRTYGISVPDADPYSTIKYGLMDALKKNNKLNDQGKKTAIIRPWYQDFTATWVPGYIRYGANEVSQQITAGNELGVREYIMWDSKNTYSEQAWLQNK